jgi:hypothetical protein
VTKRRQHRTPPARHELDDTRFADLDWVWVGDRRVFVVGRTAGGAPFGVWEDELEDSS